MKLKNDRPSRGKFEKDLCNNARPEFRGVRRYARLDLTSPWPLSLAHALNDLGGEEMEAETSLSYTMNANKNLNRGESAVTVSTNVVPFHNDEGNPVTFNIDGSPFNLIRTNLGGSIHPDYYCRRRFVSTCGTRVPQHRICMPDRQCQSCTRYQASLRLTDLQVKFPTLTQDALIAVLRSSGGDAERATTLLQAKNASVLVDSCVRYNVSKDPKAPAVVVKDGHAMMTVGSSSNIQREQERFRCCVQCASRLPSTMGGNRQCQACFLCDACVDSGAVRVCPGRENGVTELHAHPLTFTSLRKDCYCSIQGQTCVQPSGLDHNQNSKAFWSCTDCDFDVCTCCIRDPPPAPNQRDDTDSNGAGVEDGDVSDDLSQMSVLSNQESQRFNAASEERQIAREWEDAIQAATPEVDMLVGTGCVGTTVPTTSNAAGDDRDNKRSHTPFIPVAGTQLSQDATGALNKLKKTRTADDKTKVSAVDVTHAEHLLQLAETAIQDSSVRSRFFNAIGAGRTDLAGSLLLLSRSFPQNKLPDENICWCGDAIDASIDGPVTCLLGHAMHGSCASDLLLGGGSCPTCRSPMFHASLVQTEVEAAEAVIKENACRMERRASEQSCLQYLSGTSGGELGLKIGDEVLISPDKTHCRIIQSNRPFSGGWNNGMLTVCGSRGEVIDIVERSGRPVSVRVLQLFEEPGQRPVPAHNLVERDKAFRCHTCSRRAGFERSTRKCASCMLCEECCSKPRHACCRREGSWCWDPSLLCLVPRAVQKDKVEKAKGEKGSLSVAEAAKQQMTRLRAELVAVKAARDMINRQLYLNEILTARDIESVIPDELSPADICRARHLLNLARMKRRNHYNRDNRTNNQALFDNMICRELKAGNLDTVARAIRRRNVIETVEEKQWANASLETCQYVVKPHARINLRAFPRSDSPKTGFFLEPKTRFWSQHELMDKEGNMWIQVKPQLSPERLDGYEYIVGVSHTLNPNDLVGARVCRPSDWSSTPEDPGEPGMEGTIVGAHVEDKVMTVEWDSHQYGRKHYRGGYKCDLAYSKNLPPQGWICFQPGLQEHVWPSVVTRINSELTCGGCGEVLECFNGSVRDQFVSAAKAAFLPRKGDCVLVAATLEPVIVESVDADKQLVLCSFPVAAGESLQEEGPNHEHHEIFLVWYRSHDLVMPRSTAALQQPRSEERRMLFRRAMTRRQFLLFFRRNLNVARKAWSIASLPETNSSSLEAGKVRKSSDSICQECQQHSAEFDSSRTFASCLRGHLLHSRCLQQALISGGSCPKPGCKEPLWVPSVTRTIRRSDDDVACQMDRQAGVEAQVDQAESELTGQATAVTKRAMELENNADNEEANLAASSSSLKMCPACCAGPLCNENCSDMERHHGECTARLFNRKGTSACTPHGNFKVSSTEIVEKIAQLSDASMSMPDLLPRCPTHDAIVMFNGCMECGYLFTELSWRQLPKWDPLAKDRLELDKKKMNATKLLAEQVRQEAAMLQFERSSLFLGTTKSIDA